jgi:hypothetical protein
MATKTTATATAVRTSTSTATAVLEVQERAIRDDKAAERLAERKAEIIGVMSAARKTASKLSYKPLAVYTKNTGLQLLISTGFRRPTLDLSPNGPVFVAPIASTDLWKSPTQLCDELRNRSDIQALIAEFTGSKVYTARLHKQTQATGIGPVYITLDSTASISSDTIENTRQAVYQSITREVFYHFTNDTFYRGPDGKKRTLLKLDDVIGYMESIRSIIEGMYHQDDKTAVARNAAQAKQNAVNSLVATGLFTEKQALAELAKREKQAATAAAKRTK